MFLPSQETAGEALSFPVLDIHKQRRLSLSDPTHFLSLQIPGKLPCYLCLFDKLVQLPQELSDAGIG